MRWELLSYGIAIIMMFVGIFMIAYRDHAQAAHVKIETTIAVDGILQCAIIRGEGGGYIGGLSCNWKQYNKDIKKIKDEQL